MHRQVDQSRSRTIVKSVVLILLLFSPAVAQADAGIPMLPFAYPVILLFLLPVIGIEALYLRIKLHTAWGETLKGVAKANLITMVLGFPLAWILLFGLEMLFWYGLYSAGIQGQLGRIQWNPHLTEIIQVILSAPWLNPIEKRWAIPLAFVALLVPSFLVSAWLEALFINRGDWVGFNGKCSRAIWQANIISYLFLAIMGSVSLWIFIKRLHL
jgi:hypothetical protein